MLLLFFLLSLMLNGDDDDDEGFCLKYWGWEGTGALLFLWLFI
jgi:hypothetical protein